MPHIRYEIVTSPPSQRSQVNPLPPNQEHAELELHIHISS